VNKIDELTLDRARGCLVGLGVADALGQFYEAGPPLDFETPVEMKARLQFEKGEWTDDTCMAIAVGIGARDGNLLEHSGLEIVATNFYDWLRVPKGLGGQVGDVMIWAAERTAAGLLAQAAKMHAAAPNRAGNGSLMRTAPIALAYLGDNKKIDAAARSVSSLTHLNLECQEACAIWSKAISHAILFGSLDGLRIAIHELEEDRAVYWNQVVNAAERHEPKHFSKNGWVVEALQVAWSSIYRTDLDEPGAYLKAVEMCVRAGGDTDTTAAICGSLIGAMAGESGIPTTLSEQIHGWPGYRASDLAQLAVQLVTKNS